jgi:hypothetical protein
MAISSCFAALLILVTACDFPRPANIGDDQPPSDANESGDASASVDASTSIDAPIDAPDQPGTVLLVSPSGDDANDGLSMPVKTLRRAIGLAAANRDIKRIALAIGRYSSATGESFPYTVPVDVTVSGPTGGGATLAGTDSEPGISVGAGGLVDLDLEGFTTAMTATGTATLRNLRVVTGATGLQVETAGRVTATNLDIAGTAGSCATGIVLNGSAQFTVTTLTTRRLGITLNAKDDSVTTISNASISGEMGCTQTPALMMITSRNSLIINDSLLDGGPKQGIELSPSSRSFQATISNTVVRNMFNDGIIGSRLGTLTPFQMIGGELSGNGGVGAQFSFGAWTFTNVTFRQNVGAALFVTDGTLTMRDCTVSGNGHGVNISDSAGADLGTEVSSGNNVLQTTRGVALLLDGTPGATLISAVGNTWSPNIQGADENGRYTTPATISTLIPIVTGNNFAITSSGWSLRR